MSVFIEEGSGFVEVADMKATIQKQLIVQEEELNDDLFDEEEQLIEDDWVTIEKGSIALRGSIRLPNGDIPFDKERLSLLPEQCRMNLAGLIACILAEKCVELPNSIWSKDWARRFLRTICSILKLEADIYKGLCDLIEHECGNRPCFVKALNAFAEIWPSQSQSQDIFQRFHLDSVIFFHLVLRDLLVHVVTALMYDGRARVLFKNLSACTKVAWNIVGKWEDSIGNELHQDLCVYTGEKASVRSQGRWWKVGLATVGGGLALALTVPLAAPAIGAGAAAIGGTIGASMAGVLGGIHGTAILTTVFGATGAGFTGFKMLRRTDGLDEFEFHLLKGGRGLNLTLCVSGWVDKKSDFDEPWNGLKPMMVSGDLYSLQFESYYLLELGNMLKSTFTAQLRDRAMKAWIHRTALSTVMASLAWPAAVLSVSNSIDNVWAMSATRAEKAGVLLAEILTDSRAYGCRPVNLIGYSMGARVIFYCLQELKRRGADAVVENAILLGAAVTSDASLWKDARSVVAGRLVNGYTSKDWVLGFLYRYNEFAYNVAGIREIQCDGVENINLATLVNGHSQYKEKMSDILTFIGMV